MIRIRAARLVALALLLAVAGAGRARALDLRTALRDVLAADPALAARREMAEAARQRVRSAGAWDDPMVELGLVNVPTTGQLDMDPMTMRMFGVTQRVPVSGSRALVRRAAGEAARAEEASAEEARNAALGEAWDAYAGAWAAQRLAAAAVAHRGEMTRMVEAAEARYRSGAGRLDEVLQAEAERAQVLADEASYGAEARAAEGRLAMLRGRAPDGPADSLEAPPEPVLPERADALLEAASGGHPRLRALDATAARWRLGAASARRMAWPDLELRGSYGAREKLMGVEPQDGMWSASVGVMVPVFARGRARAEGAEMDAMARASDDDRRAGALELTQEVVAAHAAALAARRMRALLADTVVAALTRAHEAAWSAYAAGRTDLARVLERSHALYAEQQALTRAEQELARQTARLVALTGRPGLVGLDLPLDADGSTR